jgi:hypothetical protein
MERLVASCVYANILSTRTTWQIYRRQGGNALLSARHQRLSMKQIGTAYRPNAKIAAHAHASIVISLSVNGLTSLVQMLEEGRGTSIEALTSS